MSARLGYRDAVAAVFTAKPNVWLPSRHFYKPGGACGWRTRISECRTELHMNVRPNKTISVRRADGSLKYRLSLYCFKPEADPVSVASEGHDTNGFSLRG